MTIRVDRQHLYYETETHKLQLPVEWSFVAKTEDCPIDFEVDAAKLDTWTEPAGEPIDPARREQLLDEIAEYYSRGPIADIVGEHGALLRGKSTFRFYLHIPPSPSHYYEVGRFLAIPMAPLVKGTKDRRVMWKMDVRGITAWTSPQIPLDPEYLRFIVGRIVAKEQIGVIGLPDVY